MDPSTLSFLRGRRFYFPSGIPGNDGVSLSNVCYEELMSHFILVSANCRRNSNSSGVVAFGQILVAVEVIDRTGATFPSPALPHKAFPAFDFTWLAVSWLLYPNLTSLGKLLSLLLNTHSQLSLSYMALLGLISWAHQFPLAWLFLLPVSSEHGTVVQWREH